MKFIHCADMHLGSRLDRIYDKQQSDLRKKEIVDTFRQMVQDAVEMHVDGILIAGDLFDGKNVSDRLARVVKKEITNNPEIMFFYLQGNHEEEGFLDTFEDGYPENLKIFDTSWVSYTLGKVVISGLVLSTENLLSRYDTLHLPEDAVNIVLLHGMAGQDRDTVDSISLPSLRGKNIDYLALGHIHMRKGGEIDGRGLWKYAGCLEGRGFDECGEHGYDLIEVEETTGKINVTFHQIAKRTIHTVNLSVTGATSEADIEQKIQALIEEEQIPQKDLVRINLTGSLPIEVPVDTEYLEKNFEDAYFILQVRDQTELILDYDAFDEKSLKGRFVKLVREDDDIPAEEKRKVIQYGIAALRGRVSREGGLRCD